MSRNRYDRDDDSSYYGGRGRESSGWGGEDRTGYNSESGSRGRDYGSTDYDTRGGGDPYGGSRDYGYGRDYGRDYRRDYGRGSYDESRPGGYGEGGYGEGRDRADYGRGLHEEGRDYGRGRYGDRSGSGGRRARDGRSRVRCRDIMTKDVVVATRDTTLQQVAAMMRDEDTGVIPVVERRDAASATTTAPASTGTAETEEGRVAGNGRSSYGKLVGLITDRDIVIRAIAEGRDASATRAEEVMTTDLHSAQPNDRVIDVIRKMGDKQVRRIPVVDGGGNLRGIISMADVALETEEDRELAEALEEISSGASFWSKIFG